MTSRATIPSVPYETYETYTFPLLLTPSAAGVSGDSWRDCMVECLDPGGEVDEAGAPPSPGGPPHAARSPRRRLYWLDVMLGGGLRVPRDSSRPLLMLVKGPPGAGKSLFVQQLLYSRIVGAEGERGEHCRRSTYVSTESEPEAILANLRSLQYHRLEQTTELTPPRGVPSGVLVRRCSDIPLCIWSLPDTSYIAGSGRRPGRPRVSRTALDEVVKAIADEDGRSERFAVAFDSINALTDAAAGPFLLETLRKWPFPPEKRPRFVIVVYDTPGGAGGAEWDYAADFVIEFSGDTHLGYKAYYFEILKARFQPHTRGRHPYMIYALEQRQVMDNVEVAGPRPVLREGGLFVYPNHHTILDDMRSARPSLLLFEPRTESARWPIVPAGCGDRLLPGELVVLKGALGYKRRQFCGSFLLGDRCAEERSLLITFGEDEKVWLGDLLSRTAGIGGGSALDQAADESLRLKPIVHELAQAAGSVLPAEMLNRVTYWLRVQQPTRAVILGLDSLSAVCPLLHEERLFVSAMISLLRRHGVACMIPVGSSAVDAPLPYGLSAMATYVLEFGSDPDVAADRSTETITRVQIVTRKTKSGWHTPQSHVRTVRFSEADQEWKPSEIPTRSELEPASVGDRLPGASPPVSGDPSPGAPRTDRYEPPPTAE